MAGRERKDKAAKKQAKVEQMWGLEAQRYGHDFLREPCDLCGRVNVVNNYPDRIRRVKSFMGMGHCAWCPKSYKMLIRAIKFLRWAAKQEGYIGDKARELLSREPDAK